MLSKSKIIIGIIVFILIILGIILLYPLPLDEIVSTDDGLSVIYMGNIGIDEKSNIEYKKYYYEAGSTEFEQIKQILSKYKYHRNMRSFRDISSFVGNDAGYLLRLYSGENSMVSSGTGEIMINNHVYNIGYWGNEKALSFMEEIHSVLN